jgi:hypothetical protein
MKRIDSANKAVDLFGAGKHGFRDGNKALGINPTELTADFFNHIQEELANLVEGAGAALNPADRTQVLIAIQALINKSNNERDYKASVRVASTAAINLAAPGANIDGVAMVAGDRFLEKDNATLANRGIYIWNGAAVPATRALDADTGAELNGGAIIPVDEGTVNADTNWQLTNDGVVTIGTTSLTFSQFKSSGGIQKFTSSGSFVVPAGVKTLYVSGVGGGGGGGGANGATNAGSGGGSGAFAIESMITVIPGNTYTVTIGGGGSGGANLANGSAGGATSFGTLVTMPGGLGGAFSGNGAGFGGSPGTLSLGGAAGGDGFGQVPGAGAGNLFGPGAMARNGSSSATNSGSGGAGGVSSSSGGNGASGILIIKW